MCAVNVQLGQVGTFTGHNKKFHTPKQEESTLKAASAIFGPEQAANMMAAGALIKAKRAAENQGLTWKLLVLVFRRVCRALGDPAPYYLGRAVSCTCAAELALYLSEMCGF